jgi:hypothetical protein
MTEEERKELEWRRLQGREAADLMVLIGSGDFPMLPQAVGRFSHLPGAAAALERIDTLWREIQKNTVTASGYGQP